MDINHGSMVTLNEGVFVNSRKGYPFPVLSITNDVLRMRGEVKITSLSAVVGTKLPSGSFGTYIGTTPVKTPRGAVKSFHTVLIGNGKYLLDDPKLIKIV